MGTSNNPGRFDPRDLAPDEPFFVLRGQDIYAAARVDEWADLAELGGAPADKIAEAREIAAKMRKWPKKKVPD